MTGAYECFLCFIYVIEVNGCVGCVDGALVFDMSLYFDVLALDKGFLFIVVMPEAYIGWGKVGSMKGDCTGGGVCFDGVFF